MTKTLQLFVIALLFTSCINNSKTQHELIIFHAGSMSVPLKEMVTAFEKTQPDIKVLLEAAGSRTCARKITDLNRTCDILISADYKVIDNLLIPDHATWNLPFATNEMVIAYSKESKYAKVIDERNWPETLLNPEVSYGRSDPNSDPCGYRTVLTTKLASIYYNNPKLAASLLQKDKHHIRPKEVDLLALLEMKVIDYLFIYKSVAQQHKLEYIELSDSINLGNKNLSNFYHKASVNISGKTPSDSITMYGEPMVYGITQPINGSNKDATELFLKFFFNENDGLRIIEENGQNKILNQPNHYYHNLPTFLQKLASE